jgi:hypothetical protein
MVFGLDSGVAKGWEGTGAFSVGWECDHTSTHDLGLKRRVRINR